MADTQIRGLGSSPAPLPYTVPGAQEIILKTLYAEFDGTSAAAAWLPCIRIRAPGGGIVGEFVTADSVAAGGSADTTFSPFRRRVTPVITFPRNFGELGFTGSGTQASTYTHTVAFEDVQAADAVFVSAQAPSQPSAMGANGVPVSCADSQGNTYSLLSTHLWEASPPNVNEGCVQVFFAADSPVRPLVAGTDTITVTWSHSVFDRSIYAWLVRHDGGGFSPIELGSTADHDAATFAATQMTLTSPPWTPDRDNSLMLATLLSAKAGGVGGFGGVGGYNGYFQAQFRLLTLAQQTYLFNVQTHGANVILFANDPAGQYEIDLGQIAAFTNVPSFNGVGQNYSGGANAWKGITIWATD